MVLNKKAKNAAKVISSIIADDINGSGEFEYQARNMMKDLVHVHKIYTQTTCAGKITDPLNFVIIPGKIKFPAFNANVSHRLIKYRTIEIEELNRISAMLASFAKEPVGFIIHASIVRDATGKMVTNTGKVIDLSAEFNNTVLNLMGADLSYAVEGYALMRIYAAKTKIVLNTLIFESIFTDDGGSVELSMSLSVSV